MSDERCAEKMWGGGFHPQPCRNKAGHGKDGLYCKTHAISHPDPNAPTTTLYRASGSRIYTVQMLSRTDKTITLTTGRLKDDGGYYEKWAEAHADLVRRWEIAVESAEDRLTNTRATLAKVEAMTEDGDA